MEPDIRAVEASRKIGAQAVEFHTGGFCHQMEKAKTTKDQLNLVTGLAEAAKAAHGHDLQAHFGHGLNYTNAHWLQLVPHAEDANIGHAIVARALFIGMRDAVAQMKALLNDPAHKPRFV
jgi:pyridoxine 5-phosphate synthase